MCIVWFLQSEIVCKYFSFFDCGRDTVLSTRFQSKVLAGQVNQRPGDKGVMLDEDSKDTTGTEEGLDLRDSRWQQPVQNSLNT